MKIEKSIKEYAIHGVKYVLVFIILICVYMLSLIGTSLISSTWMKDNVVKSSEILKTEGEKKCVTIGYKDVYKFKNKYINQLLKQNKLKMTIPDKPKSKNQKYITI